MWRAQAEAEGLTLLKADNKTGYFGVHHHPANTKPYEAQVSRGGNMVSLGSFATAEEAALCVARSPEGQEAAKQAAAAPPLTSEEARQQAEAEGLTLLRRGGGTREDLWTNECTATERSGPSTLHVHAPPIAIVDCRLRS